MGASKTIIGISVCLGALFVGCVIGLAMGGFGICAVTFSPGLVGSSAAVGALFGGTLAFFWPKAWWAGALAFSAPMLIGAAFGASAGEWQRVVGIGVCGSRLNSRSLRRPLPSSPEPKTMTTILPSNPA